MTWAALTHSIDTGNSPPMCQQARRLPVYQRDEVKNLLKDMLDKDFIKPSRSPWVSPIVVVRKKDGSARFYVDYRRLNSVTRKDAFPLLRINDTLDTLAGAQHWTW